MAEAEPVLVHWTEPEVIASMRSLEATIGWSSTLKPTSLNMSFSIATISGTWPHQVVEAAWGRLVGPASVCLTAGAAVGAAAAGAVAAGAAVGAGAAAGAQAASSPAVAPRPSRATNRRLVMIAVEPEAWSMVALL